MTLPGILAGLVVIGILERLLHKRRQRHQPDRFARTLALFQMPNDPRRPQ